MRGMWVAAAGLVLATGCAGLPQTSRTAVIHDVKFEATLAPADLTVHVGDEIRWVNHRTLPRAHRHSRPDCRDVVVRSRFHRHDGRGERVEGVRAEQKRESLFQQAHRHQLQCAYAIG
jgi:plastocyanin